MRGWAYVYTEPYVGLIGCPPAGVIEDDVVIGRMIFLPEDDTQMRSSDIIVSQSDLMCEGSHLSHSIQATWTIAWLCANMTLRA